MKISVIVPVLNEEKTLEKTLKSIKNQTYKNFEIIVVDNGSTDKSVEIARKYTTNIFFEEKKGSINAIVKGIKNSKGDIFLTCDADSIYPKNYFEKIFKTFKKHEKICAIYGPFMFIENGKISNFFTWISYIIMDFLSKLFTKTYIVGAANFAIKRECYFKVGGYDIKSNLASQDFRLARKISKVGKVSFSPFLVVFTSNRRFRKEGFFKSFKEAVILWADVAFNKNKITYEKYYTKEYYGRKYERKK
ncbi:glycosyl transferase [Thermosipho melanesiensis]|uniref:Glycosyl transferase, family 2 n=3 Tax=Thermosipho melanesiensis TaxID=46541 RepID=A6LJJ2_THEM4|nr:glycosyltransferase family 2 protein [Thermosipho melanesiensis]ABR30093.1 glycosyl transferase, family 2 [Thermosipho melanesiensis BI429]APT73290.1 glycosyl transferase [Thermosipho melanesiensis]OOC38744.1 glycosyl transferase [Thermosipho melanesiensis]OOC40549.1 glycosyl transferase [Thermosipho melanesiensis]OOC40812.1 glycosyl transferase [Thermosipho melanesiensis]